MQIFVLGMHRSGTSVVTRVLNLMGAYFGPEGINTGANQENPKGFWERQDILALNDNILHSLDAEWYRVADFTIARLANHIVEEFERQARKVILKLDAHRPWVVKEPRLCLTFPLWRRLLECPICVHVHRSPIQVAQSLKTRNGFPLGFSIALWEKYTLSALAASAGLPRILTSHAEIMARPIETVKRLYDQLVEVGVEGLRLPSEREILAFLDSNLFHEKGTGELEDQFVNQQQLDLANAFISEQVFAVKLTEDISAGAQEALRVFEKQERAADHMREVVKLFLPNDNHQPSVDVVVCIHNALEDAKNCLTSIIEKTARRYTLYIINDGSNIETSEYLHDFTRRHQHVSLLENDTAQGYTRAANQGLQASTADYVVLLNSDTIVTSGWLDKLIECGEIDPRIGIIGPLSNAASWQSVPERFDNKGDWAVNQIPYGWTLDNMANLVSMLSKKRFPRVPLINGFCFGIKRSLIMTIGYLDEEAFPCGYGEENDYCIRAINAGFELAIADHLYIYHAKSRSFGHQSRREFAKQGSEALRNKHGEEQIKRLVAEIRDNFYLKEIRQKLAEQLQNRCLLDEKTSGQTVSILFLLPVQGGGGGAHSVIQEAVGLRRLGIYTQVAVRKKNKPDFQHTYAAICEDCPDLFFFFDSRKNLVIQAAQFNIAIATVFHSIELLQDIVNKNSKTMPAYYVQDYEPWFCTEGTDQWKLAYKSYTLITNTTLFAKTRWLCEIVEKLHGLQVNKVCPSLDHSVYFPELNSSRSIWPVHVVAMIRPATPRRGAARTMRLLHRLKEEFGNRVVIKTFGCNKNSHLFMGLYSDFDFQHYGILVREEVAKLLRESDIFIDLSDYQAFGRTGLEAMACGCAAVLPYKGGVHEYAIDHENALLVDTQSDEHCHAAARKLVTNHMLRTRLRSQGLLKAADYSIHKAALSEYLLLKGRYQEWSEQRQQTLQIIHFKSSAARKSKIIQVCGLLPQASEGTLAGSSFIRVALPLNHASVKAKLAFSSTTINELKNQAPDVIVVQRTALPDPETAFQVLDYCEQRGIYTIYETDDDLFDIHDSHSESAKYRSMVEGGKIFAMNADLITVSSEFLGNKLKGINSSIAVLPNALDEGLWLSSERHPKKCDESAKVRLLYMGTRTHLDDLRVVEEAIQRLNESYGNKFTLDLIGVVPHEINMTWCNVIDIPVKVRRSYPDFVGWLRQINCWHIGIAPLEDSEFNRCKSFIKYLDYSALGLATVCSAIPAYHSVIDNWTDGVLVENTSDAWYKALKSLIDSSTLRINIALKAYEKLVRHHTLKTRAQDWADVYANLVRSAQKTNSDLVKYSDGSIQKPKKELLQSISAST